MLLSDIIARAIQILGLESDISITTSTPALTKLTDCANMIVSELTQEYVHLKHKESLVFEDGRAYYSDFSKSPKEVLSVSKNGVKQPFSMYPLYLQCDDLEGEAEVKYLYHQGVLSLNDTLELPPQFSVYTLAVGVVSEYCYRIGLVDEALFYKNRYDNSVLNLSKRLRPVSLPRRRLL